MKTIDLLPKNPYNMSYKFIFLANFHTLFTQKEILKIRGFSNHAPQKQYESMNPEFQKFSYIVRLNFVRRDYRVVGVR